MAGRLASGFAAGVCALAVGILLLASSACQQAPPGGTVRVGDIRTDPAKFAGLSVWVRGVVQSEVPAENGEFGRGYVLRDRYADIILVRTTSEVPDPGTEWF